MHNAPVVTKPLGKPNFPSPVSTVTRHSHNERSSIAYCLVGWLASGKEGWSGICQVREGSTAVGAKDKWRERGGRVWQRIGGCCGVVGDPGGKVEVRQAVGGVVVRWWWFVGRSGAAVVVARGKV